MYRRGTFLLEVNALRSLKQLLLSVFGVLLLIGTSFPVYAGDGETFYQVFTEEQTGEVFFIQNSNRDEIKEKPVVAVALGGGGARALVNVGILKALEEEGIPVDLVVGSSMGAIVAVMYGSGMPLATIEELVTSDILPSMFDLNFPFLYSLIDTRRVNYFIERILPHRRLEDFPIQTALLSYDLTNGVKYIHTSGNVSKEIQGSYSIPLFFPVAEYDGLYLIDPGVLELTPAQAAKVLGADVIISTTAFDDLPYSTYEFPIRAVTRFINIFKDRNSKAIIDRYSDVTIECEVGAYSYMDYHLAANFIALGYREAQKQIPAIKRILAEKNIPLNYRAENAGTSKKDPEAQINLAQVFSDIKYERLTYDFPRLKPLLYIGREHSIFKQELFREELMALQYGFLWQRGRFELRGLVRGKLFNYSEFKLRLIGFTPNVDLIGKLHYEHNGTDALWGGGVDLNYNRPQYTLAVGWADLAGTSYLHNAGTAGLNWDRHEFKGEIDLYTPFFRNGLSLADAKYVASQTLKVFFWDDFTFHPKVIVSNTVKSDWFSHPLLYRGIEPEEAETQNLVQASLELAYHYRFPYSLELLQCIQLKELTWFSFTDFHQRLETCYSVGAGMTCELNLLGIKPSSFGGYVAYDLNRSSWKGTINLDLSF